MTNFLEFLSNNELTIVICLMVTIFILIMAIILIDIYSKRNKKDDDFQLDIEKQSSDVDLDDSNDDLDKITIDDTQQLGMVAKNNVLDEIDVDKVTKNLEKTAEIEEIKYVEEDEELEKTKALIELQALKEELAKIEQQEALDVDTVKEETSTIMPEEPIKIESSLNEVVEEKEPEPVEIAKEVITDEISSITPPTNTLEDEVEKFEDEQEEKAIISLHELNKVKDEITDEEIEQYEDDGNEPISIKELEAMYKSVEEPVPVLVPKKEKITLPDFELKAKPIEEAYDDKNFKTTPVISPVYGLTPNESNIALEQTANLDKLNDEIRKTNEFLNALKELRKNLE